MSRHQFKLQRLLKCNPLIEIAQSTIWQRELEENKWIFPLKNDSLQRLFYQLLTQCSFCKSWKNQGLQRSPQKRHQEHKRNMLCHWITHKHWPCVQHWETLGISSDHRHFEVYLQLPLRRQITEPKLQFWEESRMSRSISLPSSFAGSPNFPKYHYPLWSQPQAHWWRRPVTLTLVQKQVNCGCLGQCQFPGWGSEEPKQRTQLGVKRQSSCRSTLLTLCFTATFALLEPCEQGIWRGVRLSLGFRVGWGHLRKTPRWLSSLQGLHE